MTYCEAFRYIKEYRCSYYRQTYVSDDFHVFEIKRPPNDTVSLLFIELSDTNRGLKVSNVNVRDLFVGEF